MQIHEAAAEAELVHPLKAAHPHEFLVRLADEVREFQAGSGPALSSSRRRAPRQVSGPER